VLVEKKGKKFNSAVLAFEKRAVTHVVSEPHLYDLEPLFSTLNYRADHICFHRFSFSKVGKYF
jgi:hypothetical protein